MPQGPCAININSVLVHKQRQLFTLLETIELGGQNHLHDVYSLKPINCYAILTLMFSGSQVKI